MEAITVSVYNREGKEVETIKLDSSVFDGNINAKAVYQAINAYRANQRKGTAATKTRGEVSGGGKKPWKQKGTGRARAGSSRSPLWKHGGVVFGPHPRDYSYELPPKIKNLALKSSLNAKAKENNLMVLDELKVEKAKTKETVQVFSNLKIDTDSKKQNSVLLLMDKIDKNVRLALRNAAFLNLSVSSDTNAYEVLNCKKLIITKDGLVQLVKRLKR